MVRIRKLALIGASALALVGVSAAAVSQTPLGARAAETYRMLELFGDVLTVVERTYVVETEPKMLIEAALDGMLNALDPHSNYLNAEDFQRLTVAQGSEKLRGEPGETVTVTFLREGEEPRDLVITREIIRVPSVRSNMEGEFGYIRIATFNENTGRELVEAVNSLRAENPAMRGVVLDLRNNGGGLLGAAIAVSDAFLEQGEIVSQRGRRPQDIARYNATAGDILEGLPLVVLINYGSASASEIVAGALNDHERATIVGLTSFGKGSVQTVMPLRNGEDGALSITTARYYTPSGASIQKIGIVPDLEVARSRREAELVARPTFIYSEAAFTNALDASIGAERRGPHTPAEQPAEDYPEDQDYQLERALDVLRVGGDLSRLERPPVQVAEAETPAE